MKCQQSSRLPSDWLSASSARSAAFGTVGGFFVAAPSCPNAIFPNNKRPACIFPEMEKTFGPLRSASATCLKIEVRFDFQYLQSDICRLSSGLPGPSRTRQQTRNPIIPVVPNCRAWRSAKAPEVRSVPDTRNHDTNRFWTSELRFPSAPARDPGIPGMFQSQVHDLHLRVFWDHVCCFT